MGGHLGDEAAALSSLRRSGVLVEAYSPGGPGAVLVLEAANADGARGVADGLPLRRAGLIDIEAFELHPLNLPHLEEANP
jgi:hypothetical protein